jgi:hypothetical protein
VKLDPWVEIFDDECTLHRIAGPRAREKFYESYGVEFVVQGRMNEDGFVHGVSDHCFMVLSIVKVDG